MQAYKSCDGRSRTLLIAMAAFSGIAAPAVAGEKLDLICESREDGSKFVVSIDELAMLAEVDGFMTFEIDSTEPKIQMKLSADKAKKISQLNCSGSVCYGEVILIDRYTGEFNWWRMSPKRENASGECLLFDGEKRF